MDPEAQRIAIAEACGWTHTQEVQGDWVGMSPTGTGIHIIPYYDSLDVIHAVEKTLTEEQQEAYAHELSQIIPQRMNCGHSDDGEPDIMVHREFDLAHATAAQRAEAFLKTIGKWTT